MHVDDTIVDSQLFLFKLTRNYSNELLGLSLSGNNSSSNATGSKSASVFVCGIGDNSPAKRHGLVRLGDQILEINGQSLCGRAHLNVTPIVHNIRELNVYIVVLRGCPEATAATTTTTTENDTQIG